MQMEINNEKIHAWIDVKKINYIFITLYSELGHIHDICVTWIFVGACCKSIHMAWVVNLNIWASRWWVSLILSVVTLLLKHDKHHGINYINIVLKYFDIDSYWGLYERITSHYVTGQRGWRLPYQHIVNNMEHKA